MPDTTLHVLIVNGARFEVSFPSIQGIQIRALACVPSDQSLIVEGSGMAEDRFLQDDDVVSLTAGPVYIYSKPPTAFGSCRS